MSILIIPHPAVLGLLSLTAGAGDQAARRFVAFHNPFEMPELLGQMT